MHGVERFKILQLVSVLKKNIFSHLTQSFVTISLEYIYAETCCSIYKIDNRYILPDMMYWFGSLYTLEVYLHEIHYIAILWSECLEELTCLKVWSARRVCEDGNKPSGFITDGTYIEYLSDLESYVENSSDWIYLLS